MITIQEEEIAHNNASERISSDLSTENTIEDEEEDKDEAPPKRRGVTFSMPQRDVQFAVRSRSQIELSMDLDGLLEDMENERKTTKGEMKFQNTSSTASDSLEFGSKFDIGSNPEIGSSLDSDNLPSLSLLQLSTE